MFEVRVGECFELASKYFATNVANSFKIKEQSIKFMAKQLDENLKSFAINCKTKEELIESWNTYGDFYFISGDDDYYFSIHYVEENAFKILEQVHNLKEK